MAKVTVSAWSRTQAPMTNMLYVRESLCGGFLSAILHIVASEGFLDLHVEKTLCWGEWLQVCH